MAKTPTPAAAPAAEEAAPKGKSIVDAKYRDRYKEQDWLGKFILSEVGVTKEVSKKVPDGDGTKTVTSKVAGGVDVDKLFTLAEKNHLDVSKFNTQRDSHGFGGRFRMTVRNMLQTVVKQRHGVYNVGGTFVKADAEWLTAKSAPEAPTHNKDGSRIAVKKVEKPAKEAVKA